MLIFAVVAGVAAIPAGKMGSKLGRKKTIVAGLAVFLAAFVVFFGVFVGMLGAKDLSINDYISVNNAYIAIDENINTYNADLSTQAQLDNRTLDEKEVLTIEGYLAYKSGNAFEGTQAYYEVYDASLTETLGEGIFEDIIKVSNEILATETDAFEVALEAIIDTVDSVTSILRVLIYPVLILGGAANMFITVNTLPLVLETGGIGGAEVKPVRKGRGDPVGFLRTTVFDTFDHNCYFTVTHHPLQRFIVAFQRT